MRGRRSVVEVDSWLQAFPGLEAMPLLVPHASTPHCDIVTQLETDPHMWHIGLPSAANARAEKRTPAESQNGTISILAF